MTNSHIAQRRLHQQRIAATNFDRPAEVVSWLGAVQAQDYTGALWAVGLRTRKATEAAVEQAVADRQIVRTWPMRGTLHFVAAADVRWMLELLTPRVLAGFARRSEWLELDEAHFTRSRDLLIKALEGGKQMRRDALYRLLEAAKIPASGGRGLHILSRLAHEGLLCFGAREGKQPTFALLDEWAPHAKRLARDEALAELAARYFTSHGPATLQDFMWWSGLTATDARSAVEMAKSKLAPETINGQTYWLASSAPAAPAPAGRGAPPVAYLLPPFDEYTVAYKDRSAVIEPAYAKHAFSGNGIFSPTVVVNGQVVGTWKRAVTKGAAGITLSPFSKLSRDAGRAVAAAADRYGEFLGTEAALVQPP
jgi:hypothetical protein